MLMRRQVVLGASAASAIAPSLVACSSGAQEQEAARRLRRPISAPPGDRAGLMRELVRYATLAPSSHNTQCWTFHLHDQGMVIAPDLARRCPVVDPDDHHLYVSLGCATENLAHAALANGLQAKVRFDAAGAGAISVGLDPTKALASPLFHAIADRQCTRSDFDGKPLAAEELRLLERAGSGSGVRVLLLSGPPWSRCWPTWSPGTRRR